MSNRLKKMRKQYPEDGFLSKPQKPKAFTDDLKNEIVAGEATHGTEITVDTLIAAASLKRPLTAGSRPIIQSKPRPISAVPLSRTLIGDLGVQAAALRPVSQLSRARRFNE